ncbi:MAG TPA: hypothetical protein VHU83_11165 [Bryobacteraceae bacterium]|jgi:hypothetical protein|nr:hypothetical protein [Bryobacteraceae bacterium]
MSHVRVVLLVAGLALCAASARANTFTQDFSGIISPFFATDQLGLGPPFDNSQVGQPVTGSITVSDVTFRVGGEQPFTGVGYVATAPATISINFPTRTFSITGEADLDLTFEVPFVYAPFYGFFLQASIQPDASFTYTLNLDALDFDQFFSSTAPNAFPVTLDANDPSVMLTSGEFDIDTTTPYTYPFDSVDWTLSTLDPGTPVPEPATAALSVLCLVALVCRGLCPVNPVEGKRRSAFQRID